MIKKIKKVMVFGAFSVLHPGHLCFFRQAKKYGNYLVVVLGRDATIKKMKRVLPRLNERARLEIITALKMVDKAVLGDKNDWYKPILKYKPAVICLGYDQKEPEGFSEQLERRKIKAKIIRIKPFKPSRYKSSKILKYD